MRATAALAFCSAMAMLACKTVPLATPDPLPVTGKTSEEVREAILQGVARAGWTNDSESVGAVVATLLIRSHSATVRVAYDDRSIRFEYVRSANLLCDPGIEPCTRIHKNYDIWVEGLRGAIEHALGLPLAALRELRVGSIAPGPSFEKIGPVSASDGNGCGLFGTQGTHQIAYAEFRAQAAAMGAAYAQIETVTQPHLTARNCFDNRYTISGIAYRQTASATASSAERDIPASWSGTGFVVDEGGAVLTNAHVVDGCRSVRVLCHGAPAAVAVAARDPANDLALLRSDSSCGAARAFRSGASIRPGDEVVVLGFPLQDQLSATPSVTAGIISNASGPGNDSRLLQFTAPVQPGNSGGPVLDMHGLVAGVVVSTLDPMSVATEQRALPQNVNFAIRGSLAQSFLESNGVGVSARAPAARMSNSDIAQDWAGSVLPVECVR